MKLEPGPGFMSFLKGGSFSLAERVADLQRPSLPRPFNVSRRRTRETGSSALHQRLSRSPGFASKPRLIRLRPTEMPKIYKPGKVAVVLSGRFAGKKVVVVKQLDEGTKERPYAHAIVAGIETYPRKVTKSMGAKKMQRRSRVKPFIKVGSE
jgi:hypothetical protein